MTEVVRYEVGAGTVLVEVADNSYVDHPARNEQGILDAGRRLEDALAAVRPAAAAVVDAMREIAPEHMEVEFGVKLAGSAGAVIARNTADGHFVLRMSWSASPDVLSEEE
jgi:hypothetical protein